MKKKKAPQTFIDAQLKLNIGGENCEINLSVPKGTTRPNALLPFARALTNKTVDVAVKEFTKDGEKISCKKGCGACCVQLVPISDTEARELTKLIKTFSKAKQNALMNKFESARKQLIDTDLWERLNHPETIGDDQMRSLGHEYFSQQIACPFLEDGACSIHPVRPLSCREFLVTSPAVYCTDPNEHDVVTVDIPTRISNAFATLGENDPQYTTAWIPLVLAPYWQQIHPKQVSKKTGPQWVEELLAKIN